jgi:hypothetical protein
VVPLTWESHHPQAAFGMTHATAAARLTGILPGTALHATTTLMRGCSGAIEFAYSRAVQEAGPFVRGIAVHGAAGVLGVADHGPAFQVRYLDASL